MGVTKAAILLLLLSFAFGYNTCFGGWAGPTEVALGSWGTAPGQFAISYQDTQDIFPTTITISSTGRIAISEDQTIKRIQIFYSGAFERSIDAFAFDLVYGLNDDLFVSGGGFRKYDSTGNLQWNKTDVSFDGLFSTVEGLIVGYDNDKKTYYLYSSTGQLIRTSTTKPLELGIVKSTPIRGNSYKYTITYPDIVYGLNLTIPYKKFIRDTSGKINAVGTKSTRKFNACGKELGLVTIPDDSRNIIRPEGGGFEEQSQVIAQYGSPVIAPNGDVYTWKRTPTTYSILKWTWQDDPNVPSGPDAPTNLTVVPAFNGLYLTWAASPQDPGCVDSYEISRATSAGGVGTTIGTVNAGMLKYSDTTAEAGTTYYYKVRAKAGSEYSVYTAEVSGKR